MTQPETIDALEEQAMTILGPMTRSAVEAWAPERAGKEWPRSSYTFGPQDIFKLSLEGKAAALTVASGPQDDPDAWRITYYDLGEDVDSEERELVYKNSSLKRQPITQADLFWLGAAESLLERTLK